MHFFKRHNEKKKNGYEKRIRKKVKRERWAGGIWKWRM